MRSWFKGADTASLCLFLADKFVSIVTDCPPDMKVYVEEILAMLRYANEFMATLCNADLWLTANERHNAIITGRGFLDAFDECAHFAYNVLNLPRWKFQPKYHALAELIFALEVSKLADVPAINPVSASTQLDEDFIGRVSKFSREVSARLIHLRTIKKYLLSLASLWSIVVPEGSEKPNRS